MNAGELAKDLARCQTKDALINELHKKTGEYLADKSQENLMAVYVLSQALTLRGLMDKTGQTKTEELLHDMDKVYRAVKTPSKNN